MEDSVIHHTFIIKLSICMMPSKLTETKSSLGALFYPHKTTITNVIACIIRCGHVQGYTHFDAGNTGNKYHTGFQLKHTMIKYVRNVRALVKPLA